MIRFPGTRLLALMMATSLLPRASMGNGGMADQGADTIQKQEAAGVQKLRDACHVSDTETDPKKIDKQSRCMERAIKALSRKLAAESALQSSVRRVYRT